MGVEEGFYLLEHSAMLLVESQLVAYIFSSMKQVASRPSFFDSEDGGHIFLQNVS
jgi:hypothetical protein